MNVEWLFYLPAPVRRVAYFGLQRAIGSRIGPVWSEFQAWEQLDPTEHDRRVEARLGRLLDRAVTSSAYYRELKLPRRETEPATEFLRHFPVLRRETVRERFLDLVSDPLRPRIQGPETPSPKKYEWVIVKTGGTTGMPTTVVHEANFRDWGRATRLYALRMAKFPLGTRYFRLWGSEQDLLHQKENLDRRVLRNLLGEVPLNAFRAKEEELLRHYRAIRNRPKIRHLMTYVDAAISLARFIEERNLPRIKFDSILSCAGTLTDEWRVALESAFEAEVFDKYGSRECADLATECSAHTGLHVHSPHAYLEVVNASGEPCRAGETGRILVTLLNNPGFPMIRYEIGDLGQWAEPGLCSCGSPFPRLRSLQGRQDDLLETEDGTQLSSVFVRHFVGVSLNRQLISEWQLEQVARHEVIFRYIPRSEAGLAENLEALRASFAKAFGETCVMRMESVAEIAPSATGKVRWIINSIQSRQGSFDSVL